MKPSARASFILFLASLVFFGAESYKKPPDSVLAILNAPMTPTLALNPAHTYALEARPLRNPPLAELSQPMLRLAGIRINPRTNGLHNVTFNATLALRRIPEGTEIKVALPPNPKLGAGRWSPDGSRFAFTNTTADGIELWIGAAATGAARRIPGLRINGVMAGGGRGGASPDLQWMPGGKALLVSMLRPQRGAPPAEPAVPPGPNVQESLSGGRGVATHEDMLQSAHDEDLFEYYASSQLALVDAATGKITPLGKPGIIDSARVSPDENYFIVTVVHRPFSYLYPARQFPREIEVWDRAGKIFHKIASLPLQVQNRGGDDPDEPEPTGPRPPRGLQWRPGEAATLMWLESIAGGAPPAAAPQPPAGGAASGRGNPRPRRPDRILALKAPFTGAPQEIYKAPRALSSLLMDEKGSLLLIDSAGGRGGPGAGSSASPADRQALLVDLAKPGAEPRKLWSRNPREPYKDPGRPMTHYETVEALLEPHGARFLTRRESQAEPPNYYLRAAAGSLTAVTGFLDPQPALRAVKKQLVTYKRGDGVDLSFTLYLPPGYQPGTRLPTVVWAYPREFEDATTAGAVTGSTQRFMEISGYSQLFFVLGGYAVLDNAAMPVVGDRRTVNDNYIDQIVMDAKAAVDKAVELGVTDPARVGVGGHSYGAFMTANLLAHTDLFKAGIAESGAYNRTLTPFGFQNERRYLWQAADMYLKVSPFMYADKIKEPLLLIHGEADDNDGTFPIQSQRMYEAVRGNGGAVRLVFLPAEAHGYRARETVEHVLWEKFAWFDKYVKNAPAAPASK
ncbi:MAG: prolyl oligopeptidase family serine peptidase [Acidobacteriia bacterium]|nr:prolyl oligopeptidase family serine peptidase [Terriglobia bacterium]